MTNKVFKGQKSMTGTEGKDSGNKDVVQVGRENIERSNKQKKS